MARIYRNGVGYDTDRPIGFENNYEYDFNEGVLNSPTLDRAAGYAAVTPRVYMGADQAPGTRIGAGGDFRPYNPQDGRNYAPRSGLASGAPRDWRDAPNGSGMSLEDASNPETMGAVFDKLDAWRKLDERNHIKETPTTVVGGRRVVVGSPEFYQAKADDISASNFERADARRIRDANMQLERDLRRAPPVILQPGVRAYGQDGTIIGEGIGLQAAPQPVPAPVFGQRGVALPNENGGYSVEWAPPEKQKPVLANDGSAAFDPEARDFIENKYRKVPDGAAQNEPVWDGNVGKWFVGGKVVADTELSALLTELSNIQTTTDFTDTDGSRKQAALEDARRRIEERKRVLSGGAQGAPATGTQGTQGGRRKFQG